MNGRILLSTGRRILTQLRHDKRTVALILVVPLVLITLLYYLFEDEQPVFDRVCLIMLGLFPFTLMFIVTSVAMLRERTSGTLERLLTTPANKADLLFGYALAFGALAALQAGLAAALAFGAFSVHTAGNAAFVVVVAIADAILGMALGLFFSAFARSEFQAVQFMPAVVFPQLFLCGLFVPRTHMAGWMQATSDALPLTYAVQALQEIGRSPHPTGVMWRDLGVVVAATLLALTLATATLRRRTA